MVDGDGAVLTKYCYACRCANDHYIDRFILYTSLNVQYPAMMIEESVLMYGMEIQHKCELMMKVILGRNDMVQLYGHMMQGMNK